jgi:hypothetical protein
LLKAEDFEFGDVVDFSLSTIDNVEHIYQNWLPAGRYALAVLSDTTEDVALAWDTKLLLLGDANNDGIVDAADYSLWADNYLSTNATWGQADFTQDAQVDGADYGVGRSLSVGSSPPVSAATVPEPSSGLLCVIGVFRSPCCGFVGARRR